MTTLALPAINTIEIRRQLWPRDCLLVKSQRLKMKMMSSLHLKDECGLHKICSSYYVSDCRIEDQHGLFYCQSSPCSLHEESRKQQRILSTDSGIGIALGDIISADICPTGLGSSCNGLSQAPHDPLLRIYLLCSPDSYLLSSILSSPLDSHLS
jgi:hypothetical protein